MPLLPLLIILSWVGSAPSARGSEANTSDAEGQVSDFLGRYTAALDRLARSEATQTIDASTRTQSIVSKYDVHHVFDENKLNAPTRIATLGYEFCTDAGSSNLHWFHDKPEFFDRRIISTPDMQSVLRKNSPPAAYYIEFKELGPVFIGVQETFARNVRAVPYMVGHYSLRDMLASKNFHMESIERSSDDKNLVKITFGYQPDSHAEHAARDSQAKKLLATAANTSKLSGRIVVDTMKSYAIREYEVLVEYLPGVNATTLVRGRNDYSAEPGLPILARSHRVSSLSDQSRDQNYVTITDLSVSRWGYSAPPDSKYTLADYGLGPARSASRGFRVHPAFWFFLSGAVLIAVGAYFKNRKSS